MAGRVVVVGSANVDLVWHGPRLPAPGETVTDGEFVQALGGKGANQAAAAAALGAEVHFVGCVGCGRTSATSRPSTMLLRPLRRKGKTIISVRP